ncbi:MAG: GMC family oxidoreductase [Polyangia bacterium]
MSAAPQAAAPADRRIEHGRDYLDGRGVLRLEADVVVVGSGASGAVVAAELAEAGQRVLVLEEGEHLPAEQLGRLRPSETVRRAWREAGMCFSVPVGDSPPINVMVGRCIGGSSVMTGGVCFRTPDEVLDEWVHEHGLKDLSPARMAPFFDEVERRSHVEVVPAELRSRSTMLFAEGARRLGYELVPNQRNTKDCCGCSRCNFGCPHKAKWSVDLTYLPRALAAGAEIFSDTAVERVLTYGEQAVGVRGRLLDAHGHRHRRFEVRAGRVVLACGGMHTPRLLFDSELDEGLPALGQGVTLHPSFRVMARFDQPVHGWRGALQSAHSNAFFHERITLMSVFVPTGVLTATLPGIGPDHLAQAAQVPYLAMFGGMIHDDPGGRLYPRRSLLGRFAGMLGGGDEPLLTYAMSRRDRAAVSRLLRVLGETFFAAGAREVYLPVLGGVQGAHGGLTADQLRGLDLDRIPAGRLECASQHPLGSCRMGTSREHAVVDARGQVFGLRELYIVDSSVLPTSLGVNPQISVMAMATRLAHGLRERRPPARYGGPL